MTMNKHRIIGKTGCLEVLTKLWQALNIFVEFIAFYAAWETNMVNRSETDSHNCLK